MNTQTKHAPAYLLTEAQERIIAHFATIQAELECLVRETKRARLAITKKARGKHDRR